LADTQAQEQRIVVDVVPVEGCDPVIGTALWVIEDARRRTLRELEGVPDEWLDMQPPMGHNTIGTILYHMAASEVGWLYTVLQQSIPPDMQELCPDDDRDDQGALARTEGSTLQMHLDRLRQARERFAAIYKEMSVDEFRRLRDIPFWTGETHWITPERVLYHLVNHDAEHRGELVMIIQHFRETLQS
jgi:uncharacterized damage-inducible protein DinB